MASQVGAWVRLAGAKLGLGVARLKYWLVRLSGPCPIFHRSSHRLRQVADQRIVFVCELCHRPTSEALADQVRAEPIEPARAQIAKWWAKESA